MHPPFRAWLSRHTAHKSRVCVPTQQSVGKSQQFAAAALLLLVEYRTSSRYIESKKGYYVLPVHGAVNGSSTSTAVRSFFSFLHQAPRHASRKPQPTLAWSELMAGFTFAREDLITSRVNAIAVVLSSVVPQKILPINTIIAANRACTMFYLMITPSSDALVGCLLLLFGRALSGHQLRRRHGDPAVRPW